MTHRRTARIIIMAGAVIGNHHHHHHFKYYGFPLRTHRSFDQHLDRIREAEAAAARALTDQVANKNPVALWLDSILGADKKTIQTADGGGGRLATMSAKSVSRGGGAAGLPVSAPGVVSQEGGRSYFDNSVAAYALGLSLCFAVNFISKSGQPGK